MAPQEKRPALSGSQTVTFDIHRLYIRSDPVTMKLKFTFLLVHTFVFTHGEKDDLPDLWNEFRGPNGSGIRMDAKIGVPSMQELLWKTPLPFGLSCPVLSEDKIFLTGIKEGLLLTIALDRMTGEIIWQRKAPEVEIEKFHASSSPATPTPPAPAKLLLATLGLTVVLEKPLQWILEDIL